MFTIHEPFSSGWNQVTIMQAESKVVNTNEVISLNLANEEGNEKMFYIFLNNANLLKQLVVATLGIQAFNREIEEKELVGKSIMVSLQPKASYYIIATIMGCDENEPIYDIPSEFF